MGSADESSICFVKASGDICKAGWYWIDGNQDGVAERYYFDQDGKLLMDTVTPDELTVDANGAWVQDGEVQKRMFQSMKIIWHIMMKFTVNSNSHR